MLHTVTPGLGPAACSTAAGSKLRKLRLSAKQQDVTFPVQARVCRGMGDMSTRVKRFRKLNEINNINVMMINSGRRPPTLIHSKTFPCF